jgi:predicted RNA binding protein YcfA (HicA-like mRNA interferase family)
MPSATAREFQNAARKLGFLRTRQTGSHERWNHPDGRAVTIPLHAGREIGPPLFFKFCGSSEFLWMSFNELINWKST